MIVKECSKCGEEKPLSDFHKQKLGKYGFRSQCKKCRKEHCQRNKEQMKKYRQENKEHISKRMKKYRQEKKEYLEEYRKKHYQDNKEYYKQWNQENRGRINERVKQRRQSDPIFKLKCNLRNRTSKAFKDKGYSKKSKTREILGVEWEVVAKHIERQFTKGMNWDNYGKWHIDHIIPLSSAKTEEEVVKLCHYSNLQPLWAEDNFSKSDSIEATQVKLRL